MMWSLYNTKVVKVKKDQVKNFDQPKTEQLMLKITSGRIYILWIIKYRLVAQRQAPGCGPASKECTPYGD